MPALVDEHDDFAAFREHGKPSQHSSSLSLNAADMQNLVKSAATGSSFLFVSYDTSNPRNTRPRRKVVFFHKLHKFSGVKRAKKGQKLSAQAGLGQTQKLQSKAQGPEEKTDSDDQNKLRMHKSTPHNQPENVSPASIMRRGNSDPFNAIAVPINAKSNEIMAFGREYLISALYNVQRTSESITATRFWNEGVIQLRDMGSASGLMAFFATAMAIISKRPCDKSRALQYQLNCTRLLRKRLATAEVSEYPSAISQVLRLFCCEILLQNVSAARIHSGILRQLLETSAAKGIDIVPQLTYALYHDANLSAMFLVRPTFDVHEWAPKIFEPYWTRASLEYPHLCRHQPERLDQSIAKFGVLTSLMFQLRDQLQFWKLIQESWTFGEIPPLVMMWLLPRSTINQCRIIDYYLDLMEDPYFSNILSPEDLWTQAYVCLAALCNSHIQAGSITKPVLAGVVLYDTLTVGLESLRNAIVQYDRISTIEGRHKYKNTLLWALFVGTSAERVQPKHSEIRDSRFSWFNVRFRTHAISMGLSRWADIERIVTKFPFSLMNASSPNWVDEHLHVTYDNEGKVRRLSSTFEFVVDAPK